MNYKERYQKDKEKKKQYYLENRDKIREYKRAYYLSRKEKQKTQTQEYYAIPANRAKKLLAKARERSLTDGLEFDLLLDDIQIPERCPYLDIPLTHEYGKGQLETNSSIDRIDSSKGYIKGNVQVISRLANTMKSNASIETLRQFAQGIHHVHGLEGQTVASYTNAFVKKYAPN